MEEREIRLKLDRETKQLVCRLLRQHAEELKEKAEGQKTFCRLLLAHQLEQTHEVLAQIQAGWKQALPTLAVGKALPEPDGDGHDQSRH
ncbi:hypothetical protein [Lihuaxuella thermophila]|uniref:Uncharacterized protein n=1 Tax=Lihuaxuella thermophila TaxID=1173111 RepID=A0A1H8GRA0_9BACL|nr:hypothetical protein [Lihuaxuella thermophila]SEN46244.1 hypothetical protein SAMN05444955_11218 [Lihuaxuella thermophila]